MEGDAILPDKNRLTLAYVLSGLLAVLLVISSVTGLLYGGYDLYDSYLATRLFIRASIQTFFSGVGALDFKATAWLVVQSKNITELALESATWLPAAVPHPTPRASGSP